MVYNCLSWVVVFCFICGTGSTLMRSLRFDQIIIFFFHWLEWLFDFFLLSSSIVTCVFFVNCLKLLIIFLRVFCPYLLLKELYYFSDIEWNMNYNMNFGMSTVIWITTFCSYSVSTGENGTIKLYYDLIGHVIIFLYFP